MLMSGEGNQVRVWTEPGGSVQRGCPGRLLYIALGLLKSVEPCLTS